MRPRLLPRSEATVYSGDSTGLRIGAKKLDAFDLLEQKSGAAPDFLQSLWLIKNGVPWKEAFAMSRAKGLAAVIVMGGFEAVTGIGTGRGGNRVSLNHRLVNRWLANLLVTTPMTDAA